MPNQPNEKNEDIELDDKEQMEDEGDSATESSPLSEQDPSIKNH